MFPFHLSQPSTPCCEIHTLGSTACCKVLKVLAFLLWGLLYLLCLFWFVCWYYPFESSNPSFKKKCRSQPKPTVLMLNFRAGPGKPRVKATLLMILCVAMPKAHTLVHPHPCPSGSPCTAVLTPSSPHWESSSPHTSNAFPARKPFTAQERPRHQECRGTADVTSTSWPMA